MKKYSIFLKLSPDIISISATDVRMFSMVNRIENILKSDLPDEEKKGVISEINQKILDGQNKPINNLRIVKKYYEPMQYFYVFDNGFRKHKYAVTSEYVIPAVCHSKGERLVELPYFYGFSEKIGRKITVDDINMIAICRMEDQIITYRDGKYGILVDDGSLDIKYKDEVSFSPKVDEIHASIVDFVESYKVKTKHKISKYY